MRKLSCGHEPSPHSEITTGTAHMPDGREICWACADAETREQMKISDRIMLYLTNDKITTWSGGVMARVTSRHARRMRTPNSHFKHERVYVRAVDLDGRHWHGSGPGDGMFIRLRATPVVTDDTETESE